MLRKDVNPSMDKIAAAFRDTPWEMLGLSGAVSSFAYDLIGIGYDIGSDTLDFVDRHSAAIKIDSRTMGKFDEVVDNFVLALRNGHLKNCEIWGKTLLGVFDNYVTQVLLELERPANNEGQSREESERAELDRRHLRSIVARINQATLTLRLNMAILEAEGAAAEAKEAAKNAQESAGFVAGATLADRFKVLARKHFWASTVFRILTVAAILAGIYVALDVPPNQVNETGEAIFRISILAGVFGLATYFGRQAAHHRDVSTWSITIKEQLLTFDGYVDPVGDSDLKNQMRATFAARVFGSSPAGKEEPGLPLGSTTLNDLVAVLTKAGSGPRPS